MTDSITTSSRLPNDPVPFSSRPLKISFCTTCKGRAHHIRKTLPANMAACADDPDVEFVLLDYQSDDGLRDWVRDTQRENIATRRLIYASYSPAPFFRISHAKNIAHRLAAGDVLCNIDADNIIVPGYSKWLRQQFTGHRGLVVAPRRYTSWDWISERIVERLLGMRKAPAGLLGRIAIDRPLFERLGGYNEDLNGWGLDDALLRLRARDAGATERMLPKEMWGQVLQHGGDLRIANMSAEDQQQSRVRLDQTIVREFLIMRRLIRMKHDPIANGGNFGCATVKVNFASKPVVLGPVSTAEAET